MPRWDHSKHTRKGPSEESTEQKSTSFISIGDDTATTSATLPTGIQPSVNSASSANTDSIKMCYRESFVDCLPLLQDWRVSTTFLSKLKSWINTSMDKRVTYDADFLAQCALILLHPDNEIPETVPKQFVYDLRSDVQQYIKYNECLEAMVAKFPPVQIDASKHYEHPVTGVNIYAERRHPGQKVVVIQIDHYESECHNPRPLVCLEAQDTTPEDLSVFTSTVNSTQPAVGSTQVMPSTPRDAIRGYTLLSSAHISMTILKQFLLVLADCLYSSDRDKIGKFVKRPCMVTVDISMSMRNASTFKEQYRGDTIHSHYGVSYHTSPRVYDLVNTNSDHSNDDIDYHINMAPNTQHRLETVIVLSDEMGKRAEEVKKLLAPKRKRDDAFEGEPDECVICRERRPAVLALQCFHKLLCTPCFYNTRKNTQTMSSLVNKNLCYECRSPVLNVLIEGVGIYSLDKEGLIE